MTNPKIIIEGEDRSGPAFRSVDQNLSKLQGGFAGVGTIMGAVGVGAAAALGAIGAAAVSAISALDDLDETAQGLGIAATKLSAYQLSAKAAGVGSEEFGAALSKLNVKLAAAGAGDKSAARLFGALEISIRDANGQLRATDEVLGDVANKFASFKDGAEKNALAVEFFGRSGAKLVAFLNEGNEGLTKFGGVSQETIEHAKKMQSSIDRTAATWEKLKLEIGGATAAAINWFLAGFSDLEVSEKIQRLTADLARLRKERDAAAENPLPGLAGRATGQFDRQISFIAEQLKELQRLQAAGGDRPTGRARTLGGEDQRARLAKEAEQIRSRSIDQEFADLQRIRANRQKMRDDIAAEEEKAAEHNASIARSYVEKWQASLDGRVSAIQQSLKTEAELEIQRYEAAKSALAEKLESDQSYAEQFRADTEALEAQHQLRLTQIVEGEADRRLDIEIANRERQLNAATYTLRQIASLQDSHSRKAFEIAKAAAMAETYITTHSAAQKTYDALASANPYVAAAAAAVVEALGLWRVSQICEYQVRRLPVGRWRHGGATERFGRSNGGCCGNSGTDPGQGGGTAPADHRDVRGRRQLLAPASARPDRSHQPGGPGGRGDRSPRKRTAMTCWAFTDAFLREALPAAGIAADRHEGIIERIRRRFHELPDAPHNPAFHDYMRNVIETELLKGKL